jgi:hypothetical protein
MKNIKRYIRKINFLMLIFFSHYKNYLNFADVMLGWFNNSIALSIVICWFWILFTASKIRLISFF